MKTALFTLIVVASFSVPTWAQDTYVDGYARNDGTYVQPHYRSQPDAYEDNNFSTSGNTNPYTGERGYANPPSMGGNGGENDFQPYQYDNPRNQPSRPSSYRKIR